MKRFISVIIASILLLATFGCTCTSCCGGQKVPTAKGSVSVAYDREKTKDLLSYYQANQGYVVTGTLLNEETDYATLANTAKVAVVKDAATVEKLTAAGWTETANWTEAQKAANDKLFGFSILEAPDSAESNKEAVTALAAWLSGSEATSLHGNELFKALISE